MGEVYRARDTRLDRTVAIKVLPPEFSADPDRLARFEREAKTIAALNHAHICTLHDIAEDTPSGPLPLASGPSPLSPVHYLVMELVEGETLAERIAGPAVARGAEVPGLHLDEALSVATQVAGALEYAHERGVIHRDLKPANIMLTPGGAVKVLDFGLAKSAVPANAGPASEQATLAPDPTIAGAVLGTPHYMSPEQARGERVDVRADVWAFGCVLYEMLAGRRAFDGGTATDVLAAVIKDEPGWDALPPSTPQDVRGLLHRCLAKDAGQRPAGMTAVSGALEQALTNAKQPGAASAISAPLPAVRTAGTGRGRQAAVAALIVATVVMAAAGLWKLVPGGPAGPSIRSIAVLPLGNVSGKLDDQYFADGMTDVLIANLGRIETLKVISRTSVMAYRGSGKPPREIARELKVDAIAEGSVLRSGDRVRITAQLIDPGAGTIVWSETYEREMRDVMTLQGDVARAIARRIQATLAPEVDERLAARPMRPDVYEDYLKGRFFFYQTTPEGLQKAEEFFTLALKKDPALALAHAGLADVNIVRSFSGLVPPAEALERAKMHAVRAIQLDDGLTEAHASLGWTSFQNWDWVTAEKEFRRALQLNPNNAVARMNYAQLLAGLGRIDDALREGQRSRELDPLSLPFHTAYASVLIGAGRYDEAIALCQEALRMNAGFFWAHHHLWRAYGQKGMFEEALASARTSLSGQGDAELVDALDRGRRQAGYTGAMRAAADTLAARARTRYVMAFYVAVLYANAGDTKAALDWLERAYQQRGALLEYIRISPELEALRPDPRYQDLLRRLNLADDQIAGSAR
jgi:TolB-like protein/tetratricopeptide (TPR) repeat protein